MKKNLEKPVVDRGISFGRSAVRRVFDQPFSIRIEINQLRTESGKRGKSTISAQSMYRKQQRQPIRCSINFYFLPSHYRACLENILALNVTVSRNGNKNLHFVSNARYFSFAFRNSGNAIAITISTGWILDKRDKFSGLVKEMAVLENEIYVARLVIFPQLATAFLRICCCWLQPLSICLV